MKGIQSILYWIYENYVTIIVCIGLIIGIVNRTVNFFKKSKQEQIDIAKAQIRQTVLKMITEAEISYDSWAKAGEIKRSEVIEKIFATYPILSKVTDQETLISWIDMEINSSLKTLREIVKVNSEQDGQA